MKVLELLRAHVVKIPPTATIREVVDLFDLYQVLVLPVVDEEDTLLGIVYEDQVVEPIVELARSRGAGSSIAELTGRTVADVMLAPPPFADEHDDIQRALELMAKTEQTRLVVTNSGVVTGSISRVDICQALLSGET